MEAHSKEHRRLKSGLSSLILFKYCFTTLETFYFRFIFFCAALLKHAVFISLTLWVNNSNVCYLRLQFTQTDNFRLLYSFSKAQVTRLCAAIRTRLAEKLQMARLSLPRNLKHNSVVKVHLCIIFFCQNQLLINNINIVSLTCRFHSCLPVFF